MNVSFIGIFPDKPLPWADLQLLPVLWALKTTLVKAFFAFGRIARLAYHDYVFGEVFTSTVSGKNVFNRQFAFNSTIDALIWVFFFFEPFANGCAPMNFARTEFLPSIHDDAIVFFTETGGFRNDFGVLVVNDLSDGFDGTWRHDLRLYAVMRINYLFVLTSEYEHQYGSKECHG